MIFFSRKVFIADLLEGVVDIHNHLLPAIDDGSPDLETTQAMIKAFKELGFQGAYTTPHTMEDYYGNDAATITTTFTDTKERLGGHAAFLLGTASEYMMDAGFSGILESKNYLTLPGQRLLFEFSYFQKPVEAEQLIFDMNHQKLTPILAHPERYLYLSIPGILDLKARGCDLQLNLLSLTGHYGKEAKIKALKLLETEAFNFIGTDAHKVEHLQAIKEIKVSNRQKQQFNTLVQNHKHSIDQNS